MNLPPIDQKSLILHGILEGHHLPAAHEGWLDWITDDGNPLWLSVETNHKTGAYLHITDVTQWETLL